MVTDGISITCNECNNRIDIGFKETCDFNCPYCNNNFYIIFYTDIIRIRRYEKNGLVFMRSYVRW